MECPNCKTKSEGRFCPSCGGPLAGATCRTCGAALVVGARFCTQCGESVALHRPSRVPWYIAGAAVLGMILALLIPALQRGPAAPNQQGSFPASGAGNGSPPPLTGTPREQADRLFNRIMQEREAGNAERAAFFLPMAISAYQQAGELDADGLYHLSILLTARGDFAEARQTAERVLSTNPNHLLALAAAADAAAQAGDSTAARNYYQQFLQKYDAEKDKPLPEYSDHTRILPDYRNTAETFLSRR